MNTNRARTLFAHNTFYEMKDNDTNRWQDDWEFTPDDVTAMVEGFDDMEAVDWEGCYGSTKYVVNTSHGRVTLKLVIEETASRPYYVDDSGIIAGYDCGYELRDLDMYTDDGEEVYDKAVYEGLRESVREF